MKIEQKFDELGMFFKSSSDKLKTDENPVELDLNNFIFLDKESLPLKNGVIGGFLTVYLTYFDNVTASTTIMMEGTNAGEKAIEEIVTDPTLRKIACQESRYRQFYSKREEG